MRSSRITLGIAALLATPFGCSETPAPVAPVTVAEPAKVAEAPPPAVADLAPVAAPADVFAVARWKNPGATISGLSSCAGVPGQIAETTLKHLIEKAMAHAFRGLDGRQIGEAIAFDAPLDLVVALDAGRRGQPQAMWAFSVGLTSLERAKGAMDAAGPLVELTTGLFRVGNKDSSDLTCVVGPAAGAAPARLICGQHDKDVATLGPYLARNVPLSPPPATDMAAELDFKPIDARYGADLRRWAGLLPALSRTQFIGNARFDRALEDAAAGIAAEGSALSSDLDRVRIEFAVDSGTCLTAGASLQMRGKSSWLAGTISERGDHNGPPPAIFWRAPRDSDSASFGRGTDPARYAGIIQVLRGLLEGKLAQEKIGSDADRRALAGLISLNMGKDTNVVIATGHIDAAAQKPAPAPAGGKRKIDQQMVDSVLNSTLGWYLFGFDEGPEAISKWLKDVVAVYGRKGLIDPVKKELGGEAERLPAVKFVPAPAPLGRGALDLELRFEVGPKAQKDQKDQAKLALHLLLMGDGKRTWLAAGANRDELVKRLVAARAGSPDSGTLAARPGLEGLRGNPSSTSGFVTLGMFTRGLAGILSNPAVAGISGIGAQLQDISNTLNNLPHKGETPIFLSSLVTPGDAPGSRSTINVQKGSFEDLGAIILTAIRLATNAGLMPAQKP